VCSHCLLLSASRRPSPVSRVYLNYYYHLRHPVARYIYTYACGYCSIHIFVEVYNIILYRDIIDSVGRQISIGKSLLDRDNPDNGSAENEKKINARTRLGSNERALTLPWKRPTLKSSSMQKSTLIVYVRHCRVGVQRVWVHNITPK